MRKSLVLLFVLIALPLCLSAQEVTSDVQVFTGVDGIARKEHVNKKKVIPYVYVREADVMWSKVIWRMIDLREKINLPLYYPTVEVDGRRNLVSVIVDAIKNGDTPAYQDDEFRQRMTFKEIQKALGGGADTMQIPNPETGLVEQRVIFSDMDYTLCKKFLLKEVWYFDRKYTRMDTRIIAICPVLEKENAEMADRIDVSLAFWVYFPDVRQSLANAEIYNTKNDSQRESFDDLFAKRRFGSYVFRESNVYNNRSITEYAQGALDTTLESERIKSELFMMEHDVWEF